MKTLCQTTLGRYTISFEWKLEDLWVGISWRKVPVTAYKPSREAFHYVSVTVHRVDVWICLVPCLPIHIVRVV